MPVVDVLMNNQFMGFLGLTRLSRVSEILWEGNFCNLIGIAMMGVRRRPRKTLYSFWEERTGLVSDGVKDTPDF